MAVVNDHTVKAFDEDLNRLRGLISEMGGRAEQALLQAMTALNMGDLELAAQVVRDDKKIDALEARSNSSRSRRSRSAPRWPTTCAK